MDNDKRTDAPRFAYESPEGPTLDEYTRALCNGQASENDVVDLLRGIENLGRLQYLAIWD